MHQTPKTSTGQWEEPRYLALAQEGALSGLTQQRVITALHNRIWRDEGYLSYRKAAKKHTSYDDQVEADLRAIALAICYLEEPAHPAPRTNA
jgi:hypothetical protein